MDKSWIIKSYRAIKGDDKKSGDDAAAVKSEEESTPLELIEEAEHSPDEQFTITERSIEQVPIQHQAKTEVARKMETKPPPRSDIKPSAAGLTFGSQAVLQECWKKDELTGSPQDKKIQRLPESDTTSPSKTEPDFLYRPLFHDQRNSIWYVKPYKNRKIAALTFDLCERAREKAEYDADIVNYLRKQNVKATFFAGGKWMKTHSEKTMQLMADPLFEIGNHAWTHGNFRLLTKEEMKQQILWTQAQYELLRTELQSRSCVNQLQDEMKKIPKSIGIFRFPYGTCRSEALKLLSRYGLPAIQWNIVSGDPARRQTAGGIKRIVLSQIRPGSIIIFHANGRGHGTAGALPEIIPALRKKGYTFVTVSELIYMGKIVATETCYELKPNATKNLQIAPKVPGEQYYGRLSSLGK